MRLILLPVLLVGCAEPYVEGCGDYHGPVVEVWGPRSVDLGRTAAFDASRSYGYCQAALSYEWIVEGPPTSSLDASVVGSSNGTARADAISFQPDAVGTWWVGVAITDEYGTESGLAELSFEADVD